ncbi:MAG: beta strand repeat-containing protein [Vicinamibacterales bacterium]
MTVSFRLAIVIALVFDVRSASAQGAIANGQNHNGTIGAPGASDSWTLTVIQGDTISVSVAEVGPNSDFAPWVRLLDPGAVQVATSTSSLVAQVNVIAAASGTYTVVVASGDVGNDGTGSYTLTVAKTPGAFVVPSGDQGGAIANGSSNSGEITRGDLDIWTFEAVQGDTMVLSIGETASADTFNPWIRLRGPDGTPIAAQSGSVVAHLSATASSTGVYTVVVATADVGNDGTGAYVLTLARTPATFVVPTGDEGGVLANGANHAGAITIGDLDMWSFTAQQGDSIGLSIGQVTETATFNPWLRVYGPSGQLVGAESASVVAQLDLAAPATGTYVVVIGTGDVGNEGLGTYVLTLAQVPGAFVVTGGDEGGAVATGATVNAAITIGDLDLWTFFAVQGAALSATMTELSSADTFNPWIRLRGPDGALLSALSSSVTIQINVIAPVTGLYTIVAGTADTGNDGTGTYSLNIAGATPPPTTLDDFYVVAGNTPRVVPPAGVLTNDNANGGGALSAQLVAGATHGNVSLEANGGFTYTPNAGFLGSDAFSYRAVSAAGPGNVATVAISVVETTTVQAPTDLQASLIAGNTVTLRWTAPAVGLQATGYLLEGGVSPGGVLATIATGSTDPIFTFAAPSGAFYVRMRAVSASLISAPSNEIRIFVNVPAPPSAPAGLVGFANGSTLGLVWRNTYLGGAPTSLRLNVSGAVNATLPIGLAGSFSFNGVPPGTYTFTVQAINGAGVSPPSAPVTLSFPSACLGAPLSPDGFLAFRSGRTVNVLWQPRSVGVAPSGYILDVSGGFVGSFVTPTTSLAGAVGPGTYQLRVAAVNPCGASAFTPVQTVIVP